MAPRRIVLLQPALPSYRMDLFDRLSRHWGPAFEVHWSPDAELGALESRGASSPWSRPLGPMRKVGGLAWQRGAPGLCLRAGDVLVVAGAPRILSTLLLVARAKARGARVVWWGHYRGPQARQWRIYLRLIIMRSADAVMFYTDREVARYLTGPGSRDRRVVTGLDNGLNLDPIRAARAPYRAADRPCEVLFLGRLTRKASLRLLVEALSQPHAEGILAHVVGDGPEADEARARAAALGLGERIVWHPGTVDETAIAAVANRCRAFVYPGEVGLSLIHGLAYGLPAVIHSEMSRQMPEVAAFEEGVTGRSFRRGDARDLARVLGGLLEDPARLDAMSAAAVAATERSFNTEEMARRFIATVESLDPLPAGPASRDGRPRPGGPP